MKKILLVISLVLCYAQFAYAQPGVTIRVTLAALDTVVSTAVDTDLVDLQTGYGEMVPPLTVYVRAVKLSDSIMLSIYYDITADSTNTGWFTIDSTLIPSDVAGAGEVKTALDSLVLNNMRFMNMRIRTVGGASNDKGAGSTFTITGIGQAASRRR